MTSRMIALAGSAALALSGCGGAGPPSAPAVAAAPVPSAKPPTPPLPAAEATRPVKPPSAADLVAAGQSAAKVENWTRALEIFEEAARLDPKNTDALYYLGVAAQRRAGRLPDGRARRILYRRSAEVFRTLKGLVVPMPRDRTGTIGQAFFNEACLFALDDQPDRALGSLRDAIDAGFDDIAALETDGVFAAIRPRPGFAPLVDAARATVRADVAREMAAFRPFPFTFTLTDVDGRRVRLDSFKGRVTIVDFWGTWCPPCKREIPHFVELLARHEAAGLAIVGINEERAPREEWPGLIRDYVKEAGITYPCVLGDDATTGLVPDFTGYPTTLFLDRSGTVRFRKTGYTPLTKLEAIVTALLEEPSGTSSPR